MMFETMVPAKNGPKPGLKNVPHSVAAVHTKPVLQQKAISVQPQRSVNLRSTQVESTSTWSQIFNPVVLMHLRAGALENGARLLDSSVAEGVGIIGTFLKPAIAIPRIFFFLLLGSAGIDGFEHFDNWLISAACLLCMAVGFGGLLLGAYIFILACRDSGSASMVRRRSDNWATYLLWDAVAIIVITALHVHGVNFHSWPLSMVQGTLDFHPIQ